MKLFVKTLLALLFISASASAQQSARSVPVVSGVSYPLAVYRHSVISNIQYTLGFSIPAEKSKAIEGKETVRFNLKQADQPLQIDFKQDADHVKTITVNDKPVAVDLQNEQLLIAAHYLHAGINNIDIQFIAGDASLNRNDDFMYALFVPDRARTVFPCFDQPDLKANFLLTLEVPSGWKVLANGNKKDSVTNGEKITYHFASSDKLPTYLFSFTVGKYSSVTEMIGKRPAEFLYRETDPTKIKLSVDSVFRAHQDAISFLEGWTSIKFPFQKVGFVGIPFFQFGGMEHPGEVQYNASGLFLDEGATKDQFIARSNLISHETAHMWFGDMVTMEWFNDVWMKEVFANFMADKVTEKLMGSETFNLKFLQDHYPAAYSIDRTRGANPIRQDLDNLQDAGSLYGNIIYHKAPIMMRQLERLMGKENFQKGVREYLKKYAYGNATWPDLIGILSKYTKADLYSWNKVWVNQPGRPVFEYQATYAAGKISHFTLSQHPETGTARIWPQVFSITLVYPNRQQTITVNMNQQQISLNAVEGLAKPLFILFNSDGMGYGIFPADQALTAHLFTLESPLQRASAYITAYENMLAGRYFNAEELLNLFSKGINIEKDEMNLRLLSGYMANLYWNFTPPAERPRLGLMLESALWNAMKQQTKPNSKKVLFKTFQDIYLSPVAGAKIYQIWKSQQAPVGVKLTEDDYTALALTIALKSDTVTSVLKEQQQRITNIDRKNRLAFLMPALSLDVKQRDSLFSSFKAVKNRRKEAWVVSALGFLNHPMRQSTSIKYLPESLEWLQDVQKTGDVFFPQNWLGATFGGYQSREAYKIVEDFLNSHPDYNSKLKDKILQATDYLYRAQKPQPTLP